MHNKNMFSALESVDKKNDFEAIRLTLAPPEKIRAWSYGEVRVPETINYRTFRPEAGGLFCAKIFGPTKDYECVCGKYKRMKYRGVVCEKCGVEVTLTKVRRERMGHINLACPVAHILFFKALPSRIGLVLDLTMRDIERILYFEVYVVIDPQRIPDLERGQLLTVEQHNELSEAHPGGFRAGIGAEGVRDFLKEINLEDEIELLREELKDAGSDTRRKKIFKRLKIIESFYRAKIRPEWMVLEALPVLPPDLRPLVQLEGGRFTTSDLNDLYRRVINRNNRLQRLIELGAPDVIINNEKRMLQESVDSLLDNGRRGKPAVGANRRTLKSVVDIIKGKSGRFRQNLLGKRVDFSGRSVIVVGPDLKLHQCGLPKQMALTLFRPFVFNKLMEEGHVGNLKGARMMIDNEDPAVWGVLERVISQHPVLLNRAPTLHRLGVQAFEPVLIEGKAIQLHPLVCVAFNADFDGDQMAVHVPLALESQTEARVLMLASNNILAPANGEPIIVPTQDVVLGLYYATRKREDAPGAGMHFTDIMEVERALANNIITLQTPIKVRIPSDMSAQTWDEYEQAPPPMLVDTTAGRALLKRFLPLNIPFENINQTLKKRDIVQLIKDSFRLCGHRDTVIFCDQLMRFGFEKATKAGISVCMDDMIIPPEKTTIIAETESKIEETHQQYSNGLLTEDERYNKSVDLWDKAGERVSREMMNSISLEPVLDDKGKAMLDDDGQPIRRDSFNSIHMMADSGARGSETQIKQLAGMRGLMTKPDGRIMENAITANFREGLSVLQYFISTHGARKGLSDTALKTANSGYLTRRLVDVTQDIVVSELDCGSTNGIAMRPLLKDGDEIVPLLDRIVGRTLASDVLHPQTGKVVYEADTYVTEKEAGIIAEAGVDEVKVHSPVTCRTHFGLCVKCYGRDLGRGGKVCIGEAVGVVAAQSIGEPGTQLTMRTFHIGGAASREVMADNVTARHNGVAKLDAVRYVTNKDGDLIVVSRSGNMMVQEQSGRERERYRLQYGQVLKVKNGEKIKAGQMLSQRDPMTRPIIAEYAGTVKLENFEMGVNAREQTDDQTGLSLITITENKQGTKKAKQPQMKFIGKNGEPVQIIGTDTPVTIPLFPGTVLSVVDGMKIHIGDNIAKLPQKAARSRDITGGLPRVAELFEAREPKEPAILSNASGRVSLRGAHRSKQVVAIVDDNKKETHVVVKNRKILYKNDSMVHKGDIIVEKADEEPAIIAKFNGLLYLHEREQKGKKKEQEIEIEVLAAEYHHIPKGRTILAQDGSSISRGEEIVDGENNPHQILATRGTESLVEHIVNEVQDVYRLQGVNINDKHIEVIIHQMMRCISITDSGDSTFIPGDLVMRSELRAANAILEEEGKNLAKSKDILLGITKASLATDSFISAASFQETSRVLTEAAVAGRRDVLRGLKENVIVGRLVPAGTGFVHYQRMKDNDTQWMAEDMLREELQASGDTPPTEDIPPAEEKTKAAS
ncbi:MAG: DNA-directed RNA polymerase subunit beta' [Gammaproteobacteria bacterium WSBS_2016_MAG_OTU1]